MAEVASAIIKASLRLLKVKESGETLSADELADGLIALNDLLDEWSLQGYMQTNKAKLTQTLTPSTATYTFGASGHNSTRPVRITKAWIRDSGGIDYPLTIIGSDRFDDIESKTQESTIPQYLYYRAEYPQGIVNLWPVPSAAYTLHLEIWATLGTIASGATSVDLAPGYIGAIKPCLAVKIAPEYKIHETFPLVQKQAEDAIAWIKRVNTHDRPVMSGFSNGGVYLGPV
jgi:hypothetical protein